MTAPTILPDTDNFADAFDRLADMSSDVPAPAVEAPATSEETISTTSANNAPIADGEEGPTTYDEAPEEAATTEAPASTATSEESADDLMARLRTMLKPEPAPALVPPSEEASPTAAPTLFSAEEQETLSAYERDWPEIAAAEGLRARKMAHDIVSHIFAELAPVLRPIMDSTAALDTREYLSVLESKVPDYRDIRDNVEAWALDTKHPTYLRDAYQRVIQEGTADEVVDLIERYRKEAGGSAPAPAPAPKRKMESELPAATKKAVASLAPVSSKRSVVTGTTDPLDFDGAFSAFADDA